MPGVFNPDMTHKAADGFQPGITLRDRRSARRPIDYPFPRPNLGAGGLGGGDVSDDRPLGQYEAAARLVERQVFRQQAIAGEAARQLGTG